MSFGYEYKFDIPVDDIKEIHLAEVIVDYLSHDNYEVYQEIQVWQGSTVTDIVARRGNILYGIETKMSLSLQVLSQAQKNCQKYHYSGIAYATMRKVDKQNRRYSRSNSHDMAYHICYMLGIGMIQVQFTGASNMDYCLARVEERQPPKLFRKNHKFVKDRILSILTEEHKTFCKAGSSTGGHLTPYKMTMQRVKKIIGENPGCDMNILMENLKQHHYSINSVRASLINALREFESGWCLIKKEGKKNIFYVR